MNNLNNQNIFYYFIFIIIFIYITNYQLSQKNILTFILLGFIIYFYLNYLEKNKNNPNNNPINNSNNNPINNSNNNSNNNRENIINSINYPFLFKNKEILNIYSNLYILTYYNIVSYKDSLYYINKFLKLFYIMIENDISNYNSKYYIQNYFEYAKEAINLLYSIIINIPSQDGLYFDLKTQKNTFIKNPTDKLLNNEITNLINIVDSIKEIIIRENNFYNSNHKNINIYSNFIYNNLENNINNKSLIKSFNLY